MRERAEGNARMRERVRMIAEKAAAEGGGKEGWLMAKLKSSRDLVPAAPPAKRRRRRGSRSDGEGRRCVCRSVVSGDKGNGCEFIRRATRSTSSELVLVVEKVRTWRRRGGAARTRRSWSMDVELQKLLLNKFDQLYLS
jgi:hypothetical protein